MALPLAEFAAGPGAVSFGRRTVLALRERVLQAPAEVTVVAAGDDTSRREVRPSGSRLTEREKEEKETTENRSSDSEKKNSRPEERVSRPSHPCCMSRVLTVRSRTDQLRTPSSCRSQTDRGSPGKQQKNKKDECPVNTLAIWAPLSPRACLSPAADMVGHSGHCWRASNESGMAAMSKPVWYW